MDLVAFQSHLTANPPGLVLDTDVLASLSCGNLIPLLEQAWPESCYVTNTVHDELEHLIVKGTVLCANYSLGRAWVRDHVEADETLMIRTDEFRSRLAAPSDPPWQHSGEASTLALVERVPDSVAALQDRDARTVARTERIPFLSILDLMRGFAANRHTSCTVLLASHRLMVNNGRRVGYVAEAAEFCSKGCLDHP